MLDASGSMAKKIGGVSKYELAKNEAFSFGSKLENANVLMRVFGSEGNNKTPEKYNPAMQSEECTDSKRMTSKASAIH